MARRAWPSKVFTPIGTGGRTSRSRSRHQAPKECPLSERYGVARGSEALHGRGVGREAEIVAKVAGVVTLSLWLKRLIEQFLSSRILNESILRGEMSDVVRDVEQGVETGRARHGRHKQ
jgi:hypothetical protein